MRNALRVAAIVRNIGMEFCGDLINGRLVYFWSALGMAAHESFLCPFLVSRMPGFRNSVTSQN